MLWGIIGIGALIVIALVVFLWAACIVAGRADDEVERWLNERDES